MILSLSMSWRTILVIVFVSAGLALIYSQSSNIVFASSPLDVTTSDSTVLTTEGTTVFWTTTQGTTVSWTTSVGVTTTPTTVTMISTVTQPTTVTTSVATTTVFYGTALTVTYATGYTTVPTTLIVGTASTTLISTFLSSTTTTIRSTSSTTPFVTVSYGATVTTVPTSTLTVQGVQMYTIYTGVQTVTDQYTQTVLVPTTITGGSTITKPATITASVTSTIPTTTGTIYETQTVPTTLTALETLTTTTSSVIPVMPTTTSENTGGFGFTSNPLIPGVVILTVIAAAIGVTRVSPRLRRRPEPIKETEPETSIISPQDSAEAFARQLPSVQPTATIIGAPPASPPGEPSLVHEEYIFCSTCGAQRTPNLPKCPDCGRDYEMLTEASEVGDEASVKAEQAIEKQEREAGQVEEGPE